MNAEFVLPLGDRELGGTGKLPPLVSQTLAAPE